MKTDGKGEYILREYELTDIDYYIASFCNFKDMLNSLLRKDPETRQAILNARYKDLLCLQVQAEEIHKRLHDIAGDAVLKADRHEAARAAGEHPYTYGSD